MFSRLIKNWIGSGIDRLHPLSIDPIRIANALSLWIAMVLISQIPILISYWSVFGHRLMPLLFACLVMVLAIPICNYFKKFFLARNLLVASFSIYICASTFIWNVNLGTQYFLLLGVFACPFFYFPRENRLSLTNMILFIGLFFILETYFSLQLGNKVQSAENFSGLRHTNILLFCISTLVCSFFIQRNTKISWLKQHKDSKKSQQLLENTFPKAFVDNLKTDAPILKKHLPQVTVLFADIQGFTDLCQQQSTHGIVCLLDDLYSRFDSITTSFGLEKIKTIGDEYMAVSGAPNFTHQHAELACLCALEMQKCYAIFCQDNNLKTGLRIGLASGNVVAGMIGTDKYSYDVWGNAVNLAARMQKLGETGKIQVSQVTAELAMHLFQFSLRGEILVKGLGKIKAYWLISENQNVQT